MARVFAGGGDDAVSSATFAQGGVGNDLVLLFYFGAEDVLVDIAGGALTLPGGVAASGFERLDLTTGDGDDTLRGGQFADTLNGGGGRNELDGRGGDDLLLSSIGFFDTAEGAMRGGNGEDTIRADGAEIFLGDGGRGDDGIEISNGTLRGGAGDDSLVSGIELDEIDSNPRSTFAGQATIEGGFGNDLIAIDRGSALGGRGRDTIEALQNTGGQVTIDGGEGGDVYDVFFGQRIGENIIIEDTGAFGRDRLELAQFDDPFVLPDDIEDLLIGGGTVVGNAASNVIQASFPFPVESTISGLAGRDTLVGGRGADTLVGGTGADLFVYDVRPGSVDVLRDFRSGTDFIGFAADRLAASAPVGPLDPALFGAPGSDALVIFDAATGILSLRAESGPIEVFRVREGRVVEASDIVILPRDYDPFG